MSNRKKVMLFILVVVVAGLILRSVWNHLDSSSPQHTKLEFPGPHVSDVRPGSAATTKALASTCTCFR